MSEELKSCPFCGGEAEIIQNDIGLFIGCFHEDCPIGPATSTYVDGYATEAEAVAAWNARAMREEIVRCRDCKHFTYADATHGNDDWCAKHEHIGWSVNGYCAWAERR